MIEKDFPAFGEDGEVECRVLSRIIAERPATMRPAPRKPPEGGPGPEALAELESLVQEVARQSYPGVWVGEKGMTAVELLELHERNDKLPEEDRLWPGQVLVPGKGGWTMRMPPVGVTMLSGLDVVMHFSDEMEPDDYGELWSHVAGIAFAREGAVVTRAFSSGHPPDPVYHYTTVENIPAGLVGVCMEDLEYDCPPNPEVNFVIPETERVKAFLAERGEYLG